MKKFAKKHSILFFSIMSLVFSLILLPLHSLFPAIGTYAVSFTQFGPLFSVLLLAYLMKEEGILQDISGRFAFGKISWKWSAIILILNVALLLSSGLALSLLGVEGVAWSGSLLFYVLNFMGIVFGAIAEETGWRGYLLPEFQKRFSPMKSAVYTGIIWGVWHLNFTGGVAGFLFYTLTIIETSIIMTWIYNRTKGSLPLMVLYHIFFNLFSRMLLWQRFRLELFIAESLLFGIVCFYIYTADRESFTQSHPFPRAG